MRQRRGWRDHDRRREQLLEQALELAVRGTGDVSPRRRELHAVSRQRVAGAFLEARIELEADVRAQSEIDQPLAAEGQKAAVEPLILGDEVGQAERDRLGERPVDDRQASTSRRRVRAPWC